VVNFGTLPQTPAALAAAPPLQPSEEPGVAIRRVPKLPRDHAGAVPVRVHVSAAVPQIDMPTEAIDRLAAHAAESRTLDKCAFAIGCGWSSVCSWQSMLAIVVKLPSPAAGRPAPACKRTRQPIGADRMGAPIRIYGEPRVGGTKGRLSAQDRTADGKVPGNALLRRASDRRFLSALCACHLDIFGLPSDFDGRVPSKP
jgi:hypothetical protein